MEHCKPIATPTLTNPKKVIALDSKLVDPTLYNKWIGYFMYLINTRLDIWFKVNTLSKFMVELKQEHWLAAKHVSDT
jgi:hypothetical protein